MSRILLIAFFCALLAACSKSDSDSSASTGAAPGGLDPTALGAELIPPQNGQLPADLLPPS